MAGVVTGQVERREDVDLIAGVSGARPSSHTCFVLDTPTWPRKRTVGVTVSVNVSFSPGVVTGQVEGRGDVDLIALVSDARQWVLAATGDSVFPAVKVS